MIRSPNCHSQHWVREGANLNLIVRETSSRTEAALGGLLLTSSQICLSYTFGEPVSTIPYHWTTRYGQNRSPKSLSSLCSGESPVKFVSTAFTFFPPHRANNWNILPHQTNNWSISECVSSLQFEISSLQSSSHPNLFILHLFPPFHPFLVSYFLLKLKPPLLRNTAIYIYLSLELRTRLSYCL